MGRDGAPSRRSVVEAVGRIVVERGLEGIRIRQIATEAGLSTGAVLYHFPKQDDLLFAVHQDVVETYLGGRRNAISPEAGAATQLLDVMTAGVPPWADEKVIRLLYALHGLALRSGPHSDLLSELWVREHELYLDIIRTGVGDGSFALAQDPENVATQLLALEDGLALHYTSGNSVFSPSYVLNSFAGAAAAILGCPMLLDYVGAREAGARSQPSPRSIDETHEGPPADPAENQPDPAAIAAGRPI